MQTKFCDAANIDKIENGLHKSIFQKADPYLRTRHNKIHTFISYRYAVYLLSVEGGVPSVVIPSILLHDVGWSTVSEERELLGFGPIVNEPHLRRQRFRGDIETTIMQHYCPAKF